MTRPTPKTLTTLISLVILLAVAACAAPPTSAAPTPTPTPTQAPTTTPIPATHTPSPEPTLTNTPLPTLEPGMLCAPGLPRPTGLTMDQFIGMNSFNDVPNDVNAAVGILREYHLWAWDEQELGQIQWNPSYGGDPWNFDAWYAGLKAMQPPVLVSPAIMNDHNGMTYKPYPYGMQSDDPAAYLDHAQYFYQFAARYGFVTLPDENLNLLAPAQPYLSGLGLVQYVENWNEPDKWWADKSSNFAPDEFAAMSSADYDGHCGKLGPRAGIRSADPSMRLVMGGLATGVDKFYYMLNGMRLWSDAHRAGSLPFDVINFHYYSTTGKTGKSPEQDDLIQQLKLVTDWRDKFAPDKEVWYSEFGWDTNPLTGQAARQVGPYSIEQVQGQWIIRGYLLSRAAGIDRAFMYLVRDVNSLSKTNYDTSGLTGPKPDYVRKPSWYYVYTLKNVLTGMLFSGEQPSGNEKVMVYRFDDPKTGRVVYALWAPTADGTIVPGYTLQLDPSPVSAALVSLSDSSTTGVETPLTVMDASVSLDITESPVFVVISGK